MTFFNYFIVSTVLSLLCMVKCATNIHCFICIYTVFTKYWPSPTSNFGGTVLPQSPRVSAYASIYVSSSLWVFASSELHADVGRYFHRIRAMLSFGLRLPDSCSGTGVDKTT